MSAHEIKVLDVDVPDEGIGDMIIGILRPQWKDKTINQKSLGGGYVNKMWLYKLESDEQYHDAIVVRVFTNIMGPFANRVNEIAAMQLAYSSGLAPRMLAVFTNGVAYQYCNGDDLHRSHLKDPVVARLAARALAKLHNTDVNKPTINTNGESCISYKKEFSFYKAFYQILDAFSLGSLDPDLAERVKQEMPSLSELRKELQEMELFTDRKHFSRADLTHGDFQGNNIQYAVETGEVTLLDFELSRPGLVAYDFIHLFHLGYIFQDVIRLSMPDLGGPITDDVLDIWVRPYLARTYELQGHDASDVTEKEVDRLKTEIKIMEVYYNLLQATVMHIFLMSGMKLPFIEMIKHVLKRFSEMRPSVPDMEKELFALDTEKE